MSFNLRTYLIILHNSFQFDLQFAFLLSGEVNKKRKLPRRVFLEEAKVRKQNFCCSFLAFSTCFSLKELFHSMMTQTIRDQNTAIIESYDK